MNFKIVDKKRFTFFSVMIICIIVIFIYGAYYLAFKKQQKITQYSESQKAQSLSISENTEQDLGQHIKDQNDDLKKEKTVDVTEYENKTYGYGVKFSSSWFMNNDDSESMPVKEKQDNETFLEIGGQTFWSNYADINKYTPENKPEDFHLLGLTAYKDDSESIEKFAKKIGISNFAEKEQFDTVSGIDGVQYVSPGLTKKNPNINIIFKKDNSFYVFRPRFINGDTTVSDIMENIVRSFSLK